MEAVLEWGADIIVAMQQGMAPGWDLIFEPLAWLGGTGYLYLIPLVLWSLSYRQGVRILVLITLTLYLNSLLKDVFTLPRPYTVDPRILSDGEHGHSFPSGHAQLVVVFWGLLAAWVARRWFWAVALVIMLLTGLSRPYLGVHYPSDIAVGWALGALTLWVYWWGYLRWEPRLCAVSRTHQRLWIGVGLAALLGINLLMGAGAILYGCVGMLLAAAVARELAPGLSFDGQGAPWHRAVRWAVGMLLTLQWIRLLDQLVRAMPEYSTSVTFIALLVLGLWMLVGAPLLFNLLRLNGSQRALVESSRG